jgi:phage terminase small subunit
MPPLPNPKHEQICQKRANGANQTEAYSSVGLSSNPKTAHVFFKRPEVIARVREIQQLRIERELESSEIAAKRLGLSKRWVLERLKFNAERCLRGQPVFDENGQITGTFTGRPDAAGANRALQLIGRELGMFIDRHEIGDPGEFSRLSDEELLARLEEDAAALGVPAEVIEQLALAFRSSENEGNGRNREQS